MQTKKWVFLLGFITSLAASAQTKAPKKNNNVEKTAKHKQKTVSVFGSEAEDENTSPVRKKRGDYNVLKINLFDAFYASYTMSYERFINKKISFEGTIGVTTPSTLADKSLQGLMVQTQGNLNYPYLTPAGMGVTWGVAGRYYVNRRHHVPEGSYIMVGFQNRLYKYETPSLTAPGIRTNTLVPVTVNYMDLGRIAYGHQWESLSNFVCDFYVGMAWRRQLETGPYFDSNGIYNGTRVHATKPALLVGLKIGVAF